jgi:hypothetical protein
MGRPDNFQADKFQADDPSPMIWHCCITTAKNLIGLELYFFKVLFISLFSNKLSFRYPHFLQNAQHLISV